MEPLVAHHPYNMLGYVIIIDKTLKYRTHTKILKKFVSMRRDTENNANILRYT